MAFSGIETRSISPSYADFTKTAHSIKSSESKTTSLPLETARSACPALPIRCNPLAIDFGEPDPSISLSSPGVETVLFSCSNRPSF